MYEVNEWVTVGFRSSYAPAFIEAMPLRRAGAVARPGFPEQLCSGFIEAPEGGMMESHITHVSGAAMLRLSLKRLLHGLSKAGSVQFPEQLCSGFIEAQWVLIHADSIARFPEQLCSGFIEAICLSTRHCGEGFVSGAAMLRLH